MKRSVLKGARGRKMEWKAGKGLANNDGVARRPDGRHLVSLCAVVRFLRCSRGATGDHGNRVEPGPHRLQMQKSLVKCPPERGQGKQVREDLRRYVRHTGTEPEQRGSSWASPEKQEQEECEGHRNPGTHPLHTPHPVS
jgi:hypothetical protein